MRVIDLTRLIDWAQANSGIKIPRPIFAIILIVAVTALLVLVVGAAVAVVLSFIPVKPTPPPAVPKPNLDGLVQITCGQRNLPLDGGGVVTGIQVREPMGGGAYVTGFEQIVKQKRNPPSSNFGWECQITNHGPKALFHFVVNFPIQFFYTEKDGSSKGRMRFEEPRPVSINTLAPEMPVTFSVWGQYSENVIVRIPDDFIAEQVGSTQTLRGKFLEPNFHGLTIFPQ